MTIMFKPGDQIRTKYAYPKIGPRGTSGTVKEVSGEYLTVYFPNDNSDFVGSYQMINACNVELLVKTVEKVAASWARVAASGARASASKPLDAELVTPENLEIVRKAACPHLPADPKERKAIPLASALLDYFPDALCAVARVSAAATEQHHPGQPHHWDRTKSTDEADTLFRHFLDRGTLDTDGQRHSAKVAWRALALLQKEIEASKD